MRYEDASQTGSMSSDVTARDDADHLAANDFGPATGNTITGSGTITGATGTDMSGAGAHIVSIMGANGSDSSFEDGKLSVEGKYGVLTIDAQGNYSYVRNAGTPDGVSDVFSYTLADATGDSDVAKLTINIGNIPMLQAEGTRVVPGPDGVVVLPAGVELSDVRVVGRDLVVTLPDGSTMVIVDGAVFVPQLVLGGVEVPASNLASLLIGSEGPTPAAGDLSAAPQSGGGNFEVPVQPLDPGVPLGDLLPPTELHYTPPEFHEPGQFLEDNEPPVIASGEVNVSEEGLTPNGLPDTAGSPDTTDLRINEGDLLVSDPDGDALVVTFTGTPAEVLTSDGVTITWALSDGGHVLTGTAGATTIITVEIDDVGHYTVTLSGPVDHPANNGEQGLTFVVPVNATDGEDVALGATLTVTIEDDSPRVTAGQAEPSLSVDETVLTTNDSQSFAAAFNVAFGADGPIGAAAPTYTLGVVAGPSGLVDTLTGQNVILSLTGGGVVEGRTATSNALVFTVSVNASGTVTLDQIRSVVHSVASDPDTDEAAGLSADNLITLTATATDNDQDAASLTINIGQNLSFRDDGPSVTISAGEEPNLVVDETNLGANAGPTSFISSFVVNYGADGPLDANHDGVADAGATAYSLSAVAGPSGLIDTATGQAVILSVNGSGVVEGRTATGGDLVFTVTVNGSGQVTLDQIRAVVHPDANNPDTDESVTLTSDDLVKLNITVTDGDGDTDTASVNIGQNLIFRDDGPTAGLTQNVEPNLIVDESNFAGNGGPTSFAGLFTSSFGADGPLDADHNGVADAGAKTYTLGINAGATGLFDTLTGLQVVLTVNGSGQVVGTAGPGGATVFVVSVDSAGSVTLDQQRAVVHDDPLDNDESLTPAMLNADNLVTLTLTVTDGDGDFATATANIGQNLRFEDDGPTANPTLATQPDLVVDETNFGADDTDSFTASFSGSFGADGPKDVDHNGVADADAVIYTLSVIPGASGLVDTLTGDPVILSLTGGGVVEGRVQGTNELVFTVSVAANGDVTLNQSRAVVHNDPLDPDEPGASAATLSADNLVSLTATFTDGDGDQATATIDIGQNLKFEDDGPTIDRNANSATPLVTDDTDTPNDTAGPVSFANLFTSSFGNDGFKDADDNNVEDADALRYGLSITGGNGTASGLFDTLTGDSILLRVTASGDIEGYLSSNSSVVAFTIDLDPATGSISLEQDRAIVHNDPSDPVETGGSAATMAPGLIVLTATIEDGDADKDTATANIGDAFRFEDDGPSVDRNTVAPTNLVTDDTDTPNDTAGPVSLAALFTSSFGKDGFKDADDNDLEDADALQFGLSITGGNGTASGLVDTLTGDAILLRVTASGDIEGYLQNNTSVVAFTIDLNPDTGSVSLEQDRAVVHDNPADPVESGSSAATMAAGLIVVTATITDGDGDTDTATANIGDIFKFEDDGPDAVDDIVQQPSENAAFSFGVFGNDTFGKDGVDTDNSPTVHVTFTQPPAGQGTISYSGATGLFTFTPAPGQQGSTSFTYTIIDGDGDPDTATVTINLADDSNPIPVAVTAAVDDDGLLVPDAGNPASTTGDIDANAGETIPPGSTSEAVFVGQINVNFGGDTGFVDFSNLNNTTQVVGTETVRYTWNGTTDTLTAVVDAGPRVGATLFTVNLTPSGTYTVTLVDNVIQAAGGNETSAPAVVLNYHAEDNEGDSSNTGTLTITFNDDAPTVSNTAAGVGVTLDETNAAAGNVPGSFPISGTSASAVITATSVFGADGPAASNSTVYGLSIVGGGTTSLKTAVGDFAITLVQINAQTIAGQYTNGGTQTAFTVQINANGTITVTENVPLEHNTDGSSAAAHDDSLDLTGLVNASITITDGDGDTASGSAGVGNLIVFKDDGPSINVTQTNEAGVVLTTQDADTIGNATDTATSTANFSGVFGLTSAGGADGAAAAPTLSYDLAVSAQNSGLMSHGVVINLYELANGVIVGSTALSAPLLETDASVVFSLAVASNGTVTLKQYQQVDHTVEGTTTSPFDDQFATLVNGKITLTASSTITDNDGDTATDQEVVDLGGNIRFADDGPDVNLVLSGTQIRIDETDGITAAGGEVDPVGGNLGAVTVSAATLFNFTTPHISADAPTSTVWSLVLGPPSGGLVDSGLDLSTTNANIYLYNIGGVVVGSTALVAPATVGDASVVFKVEIDSTNGNITLTQFKAVEHGNTSSLDEDSSAFIVNALQVQVTATDFDGDTDSSSVDLGSVIRFEDDGPITFEPQNASLTNAAGAPVFFDLDDPLQGGDGNILNNVGSDGATVRIPSSVDNTDSGLTSGGVKIWYILDSTGTILQGKTGTSAANAEASGTLIFTITIDQANSRYSVDMDGQVDAFTTVDFTDTNFDFIGGNKAWFGIVPNGQVGAPVDDGSQDLLITPLNNTSINTSGILGGVDTGQSVGAGEGFRIDYVVDLTGSPPNNYTPGGDETVNGHVLNAGDGPVTHWNTNGATVTMRQSTGSEVRFQAFDDTDSDNIVGDGAQDTINGIIITYNGISSGLLTPTGTLQNITLSGQNFTYKLDADGKSVLINGIAGNTGANETPATKVAIYTADGYTSMEVEHVSGDTFKFAGFGAVVQSEDPVVLSLPTEIADNDGDVVAGGDIDITLTPPVVLDLDGDGAEFLDRSAGVAYDYGNGLVATAWAGSDDGILVRDANYNGTVDDASEFVFGNDNTTDLQALNAQYGATLDANDADFASFKVWQDANSNGVVDDGELTSLTDAGIASINLVSDGKAYTGANGDVAVAGTTTYTRVDGSTGSAADAMFATGGAARTQEIERIAANSNSVTLAAAVAAAGMAASSAAAAAPSIADVGDQAFAANAFVARDAFSFGIDNAGSGNFSALAGPAFEASAFGLQAMSSASYTAIAASNIGELASQLSLGSAPTALLQATEMATSQFAAPGGGLDVAMPSVEMLASAGVAGQAQHTQVIEQIIADALQGGGGAPDINAMLNALPGQGLGENPALGALATPVGGDAPTWDMGHGGVFTFDAATSITMEALVLQPDAIQPAANG